MARPKVFVIFYSTYGHVHTVAKSVQKGLEKSGNVDVEVYQFPETLSDEILGMMHAPPKPDIPVITVDKLTEADGFLFGFPTRFGSAPAQVKSFFDATGGLWASGALFASQHGGQETTAMTFLPNLAHHGMIYVPAGFRNQNLFDNSEVIGGSAWGAGTVAGGDGSRIPTEKELSIAETQGEDFAKFAVKFAAPLPEPTAAAVATKAATATKVPAPVPAASTAVSSTATETRKAQTAAPAGSNLANTDSKKPSIFRRFINKLKAC
ncbi:hypothetical protein FBU59_001645 [Linderina macrospora]|uniref:Uncharacterized protein n=1 Tax=Linderina macrospora TaxID=4868 RepID=A0ACC1JDG5_9FUNG|nr:hypothetical protein FBU59_001645 [Linderina macrospora]